MSEQHHITPVKTLITVGVALAILTVITVGVGFMQLPPPYNVIFSIGIAVVKASLVAMFFMNLYWDKKFNALVLVISIIFLSALVGITMLDTMFRHAIIPTFTAG